MLIFVVASRAIRAGDGEHKAEIVAQKACVPEIGQSCVFVDVDLLPHVEVIPSKLVQQRTSEVGGVGHVGDLVDAFGHLDRTEIFESGKFDVRAGSLGHLSDRFAVGPDFLVRDAQEICVVVAMLA